MCRFCSSGCERRPTATRMPKGSSRAPSCIVSGTSKKRFVEGAAAAAASPSSDEEDTRRGSAGAPESMATALWAGR